MRALSLTWLGCLAGIAAGCGGGEPSAPELPLQATVQATEQITFQPNTVAIAQGGTVTWVFGAVAHNVTFAARAGAPPSINGQNANTSANRQFNSPGTFDYSCTIHPGMAGVVAVGATSGGGTNGGGNPY
jgi:plastocyanin